ncbi:triose-phosphate isomerase [Streptomyces sp. NPDC055607]
MPAPHKPLTFTNTKMLLNQAQTLRWIDDTLLPHASVLASLGFFACLPSPLIQPARARLSTRGVGVGAQDVWPERGGFTGEVSAELLSELGCSHVMIGHADRRRLFGEDDALVARKAAAAARHAMTPVVCVGEEDRIDTAQAAAHASAQTTAALAEVPAADPAIVLYEPLWAIGADQGPGLGHTAAVHAALRAALPGRTDTRLVYGGAVLPGTYTRLRTTADWDGVAIGRAAQDPGMLREVTAELLGPPA